MFPIVFFHSHPNSVTILLSYIPHIRGKINTFEVWTAYRFSLFMFTFITLAANKSAPMDESSLFLVSKILKPILFVAFRRVWTGNEYSTPLCPTNYKQIYDLKAKQAIWAKCMFTDAIRLAKFYVPLWNNCKLKIIRRLEYHHHEFSRTTFNYIIVIPTKLCIKITETDERISSKSLMNFNYVILLVRFEGLRRCVLTAAFFWYLT
jgi:hypothetical protein